MSNTTNRHAFLETVEIYFENDIAPNVSQYERKQRLPDNLYSELKRLNILNAGLSCSWGGLGFCNRDLWHLHELAGQYCSSIRSLLTVHNMVVLSIERFASEHTKNKQLVDIVKNKKLAVFALTETSAGSDSYKIQTQAVKVNGGYRIAGEKVWITGAQLSDYILLFAKVNERLTAFLVDRHDPNIIIHEKKDVFSTAASMIGDIEFNDCFIPEENRIGKEGAGLDWVANFALDHGRFSVAAGGVGVANACFKLAVQHCNERSQGGSQLRDYQLIQEKIARMSLEYIGARMFGITAAKSRDNNKSYASNWTLMAKQKSADAAKYCSEQLMQIMASRAFDNSSEAQRLFRDSRVFQIIEGTNEVNLQRIAKFAFSAEQNCFMEMFHDKT